MTAPEVNPQLTTQDIDNIIAFLGRVELKGSEARVYVGLEMKLAVLRRVLSAETPETTE